MSELIINIWFSYGKLDKLLKKFFFTVLLLLVLTMHKYMHFFLTWVSRTYINPDVEKVTLFYLFSLCVKFMFITLFFWVWKLQKHQTYSYELHLIKVLNYPWLQCNSLKITLLNKFYHHSFKSQIFISNFDYMLIKMATSTRGYQKVRRLSL